MSPDDSGFSFTILAADGGLALSLADVFRRIEHHPQLERARQREMCSALRTIGRALGKDLGSLPAQPRHLRPMLGKVTAATAGVSKGRWANARSLALKAIRIAGIKAMPGRYRDPLAPDWERLRARLPNRHFQSGLSRFMSYLTARGIGPEDATAETFALFGAELETQSLGRDPGGVYRDTCKLWNVAAATIPGWPQLRVEVPVRRRDFSMKLEQFPESFRSDVERFLSQRADPDVFSDGYCKPVRPMTARTRRRNILMAGTALIRSGAVPLSELTGLAILVDPANAKEALRFLYERTGGKKTGHIYGIATLLKVIGRHYVKLDEQALAPLRGLCRNLKPPSTGLTDKNRRFLRQFADLRKLASLLTLPQRLVAAVEAQMTGRRRDAIQVELAVAIAIELAVPIRADNLAGLRLDRHVHRGGDQVYLAIPAEETKNGSAVEAELPARVSDLLDRYIERYRPRLISEPVPWLFPGENGGRRRAGGFSSQISALITREAGVTMTLHQFRHLAAKLYLDRHPDGYETVRRLLGHKSLETTMKFYRELESVVATKRYGELTERLLAETQDKTKLVRRARGGATRGRSRART